MSRRLRANAKCPRKPLFANRLPVRSRLEKDVVVAVGVERRVEINKINGLFVDIPPQDIQIAAVVESVHERTANVARNQANGKRKVENGKCGNRTVEDGGIFVAHIPRCG